MQLSSDDDDVPYDTYSRRARGQRHAGQRESLYALQAYTAQLDAYVGGGGDWATDELDDDE